VESRDRIKYADERTMSLRTDNRGAFRNEVHGQIHVEILQDGYRTVRSQWISLSGNSDDVYQFDVPLQAGNSTDRENVILQIEDVQSPESRDDPTIREALPKSDQLFGLRGGINVSNIREGSGQQWLAASGSVFTS